jgi:hypothetical protein
MSARVIHVHPSAPAKPAEGATCNGCGVCCLAEPCPLGIVLSRRRHGACRALQWSETEHRYRCGALVLPSRLATALRPLLARWIGAGRGCDSSAEVQRA